MHGQSLISAYEAARILEVAPVTVYSWVQRGTFSVYRDTATGRLLLDKEEVEDLRPDNRIKKVTSK